MFRTLDAAKDLVLGLLPRVPGEHRYGLDSLTADEVGAAIGAEVRGARLDALRVEVTSRGTTDRARLWLDWNAAGRAASLPVSAFAKGTSTTASSRGVVSAFACHTYETRFYKQIYPRLAELTVKPYVMRAGIGGRYVIAFEDLQQRGAALRFYDADDEAPLAHVQGVVDVLATIHGRFWRSPRFSSDLSWLQTYARRPGYPFMKQLFSWSDKRFMRQDREVPDAVRKLTRLYTQNQPRFTAVWDAMPPTLCHGDCHLGNTFGNVDGRAGIYDWQVFHKMNGLRDFAYFMMHSVPTETRRAHERELLRRYLDGLAHHGAGAEVPDFASAWDSYRLLTIDGWMAIVFTIAVGGMQPLPRMEVTATRAIATMLDLDVLKAVENVARR